MLPYSYSMTYDTSLDTNTEFYDTGVPLGGETTTHQWHGYSASGIISSDLMFGTGTFTPADISARIPTAGVSADLWFDTDISTSTPTLAWVFFSNGAGGLELGGGAANLTNIFMLDRSTIDDFDSFSSAFAAPMPIQAAAVIPEPSTFALLALSMLGLVALRRR